MNSSVFSIILKKKLFSNLYIGLIDRIFFGIVKSFFILVIITAEVYK